MDDGRGFTWAFVCWALNPQLQEAARFGGDGQPDCYALPMDDHSDHWLRLEAEAWARDHPDPQINAHGAPHGLVHTGGIAHPDPRLSHVKLGGTLHWEHDPHPVVQERLAWLGSLDFEGLVTHLAGPPDKVFKGILAAEH